MSFLRYSLLFILSFNAWSAGFSSNECVMSNLQTSVTHEGKFFGLIKNDLKIEKDQCRIKITYHKILETLWDIDICREPIHMKVTSKASQSVYKRENDCHGDKSDYCHYLKDLLSVIQDHGLIFAKGDREDIKSPHGQTYCVYRLLKLYLEEGRLFSKYKPNGNIFRDRSSSNKPHKTKIKDISKHNFEEKAKELTQPKAQSDSKIESVGDQFDPMLRNAKPMIEEESETEEDDSGLRF